MIAPFNFLDDKIIITPISSCCLLIQIRPQGSHQTTDLGFTISLVSMSKMHHLLKRDVWLKNCIILSILKLTCLSMLYRVINKGVVTFNRYDIWPTQSKKWLHISIPFLSSQCWSSNRKETRLRQPWMLFKIVYEHFYFSPTRTGLLALLYKYYNIVV